MADMNAKGRRVNAAPMLGESNPFAKLTWDIVRDMRTRFDSGISSQSALAREYNVTQAQVWNIVRGKQWIET